MTSTTTSTTTTMLPKIDTIAPVLVTGGTGYVAGVLIQQLLQAGVTVHTTVRDISKHSKYQYLQDLADNSPGSIKFFAADLLIDGSFADAMKDCVIVFHTASPFVRDVNDPVRDLIEPAVQGTTNVLNEATKSLTVKKVIVTSSCAAISGPTTDGYNPAIMGTASMLTEDNWNRTSNLKNSPYNYSKTLAEMKAWVIAGSQTQWQLITINPGLVFGPGVIYHPSSTSYKIMIQYCGNPNNNPFVRSGLTNFGMCFVDVRDVATAHIAAAYSDNNTASGRYICVGHNGTYSDVCTALRTKYRSDEYPIPSYISNLPKRLVYWLAPYLSGGQFTRDFVDKYYQIQTNYDNTKSIRDLGITYRSFEETCCDMYQQLINCDAITKLESDSSSSKSKAKSHK